ncbi:MAG: hypothetical protein AB8C95_07320 [Phycisphaeraceae bacterium]
MASSIYDYFSNHKEPLFVAQFVSSISVEGVADQAIAINVFVIAADSIDAAWQKADSMIETLSDQCRNSEGQVVHSECRGISSVDELFIGNSEGQEGELQIDSFTFSSKTTIRHLLDNSRGDLPPIDQ